jgi:protein-S-isoprenylcysteine O-methyltransferase Ste14
MESGFTGAGETSGVKVPPPLIYIAGFLAGAGIELAVPLERPALAITIAGVVTGFAGWAALDGFAMLRFQRAGTSMVPMVPSTKLVTSGPYRITRNPMYVGMAFLYVAIAFAIGLVWPLAILPFVLVVVDRTVIAREEPYLERRFGDAYRDYKRRVRRWI